MASLVEQLTFPTLSVPPGSRGSIRLFVAVLVVVLIGIGATTSMRDDGPAYEANTLIGPVWLDMTPNRVPRTVSALVDTSSRTLATGEGLVVTPIENSQLTVVSYRHDNRELARQEAEIAARALVETLNDRAFGIGRFAVISPPQVRPTSRSGPLPALVMGLVAGGCFGSCALGAKRAFRTLRIEHR